MHYILNYLKLFVLDGSGYMCILVKRRNTGEKR